jgi:hypothetical protein
MSATEWVMVAEWAPPTAPLGTDTWITGFQAAELSPFTSVAVTTAKFAAVPSGSAR